MSNVSRSVKRFGGSSVRARPNYLWTAVIADRVVASTSGVNLVVLDPTDWERGATSFERATLVAVRGWLHIVPTTLAANTLFLYLGMYDEDETSTVGDIVAAYTTEDVLWTGGLQYGATGLEDNRAMHIDMHVKAKRRITSANEIRLVMTSSLSNNFSVSGVLRALVRYS